MTLNDIMELFFTPPFCFVFALIQSGLFLFLIRFLDLYEWELLPTLALLAVWVTVGALSTFGNGMISLLLSRVTPEVEVVFGATI